MRNTGHIECLLCARHCSQPMRNYCKLFSFDRRNREINLFKATQEVAESDFEPRPFAFTTCSPTHHGIFSHSSRVGSNVSVDQALDFPALGVFTQSQSTSLRRFSSSSTYRTCLCPPQVETDSGSFSLLWVACNSCMMIYDPVMEA